MKKMIIATVAFLAVCVSASAQEQTIGGSLNFSNDVGLSARYTYTWENIRLAPEFGFFFPAHGTLFDMNANVSYMFEVAPKVSIYPLAGFNVGIWSGSGTSGSSFGLNLGGGAQYDFTSRVVGFAELKGVLSDDSRGQFSMGVAYRF